MLRACKTLTVGIFLDAISVRSSILCITPIKLHMFIPGSVTLSHFQGHRSYMFLFWMQVDLSIFALRFVHLVWWSSLHSSLPHFHCIIDRHEKLFTNVPSQLCVVCAYIANSNWNVWLYVRDYLIWTCMFCLQNIYVHSLSFVFGGKNASHPMICLYSPV